MARISMAQAVIALVVSAATLLHVTYAVNYTVGNTTGWTRPSDSTFYTTWAANKTFKIGDFLVFNFLTGSHDVAIVTQDAYNSCNVTNYILLFLTGPVTLNLNTTGEHYYVCTFTGHCSSGQKLAINVVTNTTSGPSGSTTPSGAATSSRGLTFASLMAIVISLFCKFHYLIAY